jgi:hypothetical protein
MMFYLVPEAATHSSDFERLFAREKQASEYTRFKGTDGQLLPFASGSFDVVSFGRI